MVSTFNCYFASRSHWQLGVYYRSWLRQCRGVLDLKKAFDTVDHEILLTKMNRCGIQRKTLNWFKSYLTNRTQRCSVNGCLSYFTTLKCGVPQRTIPVYLECMLMTPTLLMLVLICIWFSLVYITTLKSLANGLCLTDLPWTLQKLNLCWSAPSIDFKVLCLIHWTLHW